MSDHNKKILLIEDDDFLRKMYISKFASEGFDVLDADNGARGIEIALTEKPDIILLDMILPDMTGLEILEKLKVDERIKNIPIIILSNNTEDEKIKKAMDMGVKDYLIKAYLIPSEVMDKVKKYI